MEAFTNEKGYPLLLTPRPASKASNVPEHLIRKLIASGQVKSVPAGRRRYVNMQSLYEYINRGEV